MTQISKRKLDSFLEKEMKRQFWNSIARISTAEGAYQFFSDILTDTEEIMLSKRIACAILLIRGKSATNIRESINLSFTTIATVSAWVKNAKPQTKKILLAFSKEKNWEAIMDRIDEILDKMPMQYGSDWSLTRKKRWNRSAERSQRKSLR